MPTRDIRTPFFFVRSKHSACERNFRAGGERKGETKLAILAIATGLHFFDFKRLNARLDEAHLLIPSEKLLQKVQC